MHIMFIFIYIYFVECMHNGVAVVISKRNKVSNELWKQLSVKNHQHKARAQS